MIRRETLDLGLLTELAPAGPPDADVATAVVARAMLERVVATPRDAAAVGGSPSSPDLAGPAGRPARRALSRVPARLVLASATVAVLAVAAAVLPGLGDPGADAAWTAVPGQLDRVETLRAAEECGATWRDLAPEDRPSEAQLAAMTPLVAEHRGDQSLIVVGNGGSVAACLLDGSGGYVAALTPPDAAASAAPPLVDEVVGWSGFMSRTDDDNALLAFVGRAGPDVAAVTLHPAGVLGDVDAVHATMRDGWFIAFWPVRGDDAGRDPMKTPLTLTLRTGEVLRDVVVPWDGQ